MQCNHSNRQGHNGPCFSAHRGLNAISCFLMFSLMLFVALPVTAQDGSMVPSERQRTAPADLPPEESAIVELYTQALQTVVSVFGETDRQKGEILETTRGHGSGVLLDSRRVLTVAHVVDNEQRVLVRTQDGVERRARILRMDERTDLALLELAAPLPDFLVPKRVTLGDSDRLAVGQKVIAIGNPFGLENSLSVGTVSGFREAAEESKGVRPEYIQTDAAINSGNSGGPVFDSAGRVIGIASKFWSVSGGNEGIGFAVAINTAKTLFRAEPRASGQKRAQTPCQAPTRRALKVQEPTSQKKTPQADWLRAFCRWGVFAPPPEPRGNAALGPPNPYGFGQARVTLKNRLIFISRIPWMGRFAPPPSRAATPRLARRIRMDSGRPG